MCRVDFEIVNRGLSPRAREGTVEEIRKQRKGFAGMSAEKQREIAAKGGRAAHQKGTAHEWSSDEAREAGRKGGMASRGGRGKLPVAVGRVLSEGDPESESAA